MLHLSDSNAVAHSDLISKLIDMEITLYVVCKITQISTLESVILRIHHTLIQYVLLKLKLEDIGLRHIEH